MGQQIIVVGFSPTGKVPGAYFAVNPGVGRVQAGSIPRAVLLTGNMTTGTATPNQDIVAITPGIDIGATFGARSELANMCLEAQKFPGLQLYAAPITEATSGAKATAVVVFASNATSTGTHKFYLDGVYFEVNVASGDTPTVQGDNFVTALAGLVNAPAVAVNAAGTVTLTIQNFGIRGNDHTLYNDPYLKPTGTTVQLASAPNTTIAVASNGQSLPQATINVAATAGFASAGNAIVWTSLGPQVVAYTSITGATLAGCTGGLGAMATGGSVSQLTYAVNTGSGGVVGVRFGGGTGTDDCTTVQTLLQGATYFTHATAQNDVVNAGRWKSYVAAKAAIGVQRYEHVVIGANGLYATAKTLSQTTVNAHRFRFPWIQGSEDHPSVIATAGACVATQLEQIKPNNNYDGLVLTGLHPQRSNLDIATAGDSGTQNTALQNGVSPCVTQKDGTVTLVRGCTGLSQRNSAPFYGCEEWGQARTPDTASESLSLAWSSEFVVSNPFVNADPAPGELPRPAGVATPSLWTSYAHGLLDPLIQQNWFANVDISSAYDPVGRGLLTTLNLTVTPINHRIGGNINQTF